MKWQQHDRPEKALARKYLFGSTKFVAKRSIWMPAAECLDIRLAFERGILDANSQIIAVERDPEIFAAMQASLALIAAEQHLVHHPITLNTLLHKVPVDQPIDFAFLDLCGTADATFLGWVECILAPMLTVGADVAITCTYAKRSSAFLQDTRDTLLSHWNALYNEFAGSHDYFDRHNDNRDYEPIVLPAILLKCALFRHDIRLRRPKLYGDAMPMIALKISDVRAHVGAPYYPAFSEVHMRTLLGKTFAPRTVTEPVVQLASRTIAEPVSQPTVSDLATRRSEAARKAVETRRLRQSSK